jgi:hypothetical protein
MPDGNDTDRLAAPGQLIDDPIAADTQRTEATEPSSQLVPDVGVSLEEAEGVVDRVDAWPFQFEQVVASPMGQDDPGHGLPPASLDVAPKLSQRDGLARLEIGQSGVDGVERVRIREDVRCLLQALILVKRDQGRGGSTVTSHDDVLATIDDLVEVLGERSAQIPDRNGLGHTRSVPFRVHLGEQRSRRITASATASNARRT